MSDICPRRVELVDLLTAPADAPADLRAHVASCPECRQEWSELAALPGLVARAGKLVGAGGDAAGGVVGAVGVVGGGLDGLPRLLDGVRRERRRHRRLAGLVIAGALAVAGAVLAVPLAARPSAPAATTVSAPSGPVRLVAELTPERWGTSLSVDARGLPARTLCELVVTDHAGAAQVVGWWWSAGGYVDGVRSATSVHLHEMAGVELRIAGRTVAAAAVRGR